MAKNAKVEKVKGEVVARVADGGFVEGLAQRTAASAQASAVFGEAVKRGDVKVIPVARSRWFFGGGSGNSPEGSGGGGGGAGWVSPIGYIEVREDGVEFKRIPDRRGPMLAGVAAVGIAGLVIARAIGRG
jgi:uncharacterized spore protein YtfJ